MNLRHLHCRLVNCLTLAGWVLKLPAGPWTNKTLSPWDILLFLNYLSSDSEAVSSTSSCRLSLKAACISGSLSLDIEGPRSLGGPADVVITGLSVKVRSAGHSGNSPDTINIEYLWVFRVAYSFRKSLDNSFTRHFLTGPETGISMCLKLVQVVSRASSSWTIVFRFSVL